MISAGSETWLALILIFVVVVGIGFAAKYKKHIFCIECELICIQSWLNRMFHKKKEINTVYAQLF